MTSSKGSDPELHVRLCSQSDLDDMAEIAARCQADPRRHVAYLPGDRQAIRAEIESLGEWQRTAAVAERDGEVIGWLLAECDPAIGRLWWWGPFAPSASWDEAADALFEAVVQVVPEGVGQQEACADVRSETMARWCERHDLVAGTASVLLRVDANLPRSPSMDRVRPWRLSDRAAVAELHAAAFAEAHLTPEQLVGEEQRLVLVIDDELGHVAGFVVAEIQSDGSGYIDFVAVAEASRNRGLGGALVGAATGRLFAEGATFVHLTVREDNQAARALYARLGFAEERIARPYRRGFSIG